MAGANRHDDDGDQNGDPVGVDERRHDGASHGSGQGGAPEADADGVEAPPAAEGRNPFNRASEHIA